MAGVGGGDRSHPGRSPVSAALRSMNSTPEVTGWYFAWRWCTLSGVSARLRRDRPRHRGASLRGRFHPQAASESAQSIGHVDETGAQPAALGIEPLAVVDHVKGQHSRVLSQPQGERRPFPACLLAFWIASRQQK